MSVGMFGKMCYFYHQNLKIDGRAVPFEVRYLLFIGILLICQSFYTLGEIVIPCLLLVCFDDAMHGIYASNVDT